MTLCFLFSTSPCFSLPHLMVATLRGCMFPIKCSAPGALILGIGYPTGLSTSTHCSVTPALLVSLTTISASGITCLTVTIGYQKMNTPYRSVRPLRWYWHLLSHVTNFRLTGERKTTIKTDCCDINYLASRRGIIRVIICDQTVARNVPFKMSCTKYSQISRKRLTVNSKIVQMTLRQRFMVVVWYH